MCFYVVMYAFALILLILAKMIRIPIRGTVVLFADGCCLAFGGRLRIGKELRELSLIKCIAHHSYNQETLPIQFLSRGSSSLLS